MPASSIGASPICEFVHQPGQGGRFGGERGAGGGGLFDHRGVLLGGAVHIVDGGADLFERCGLILGRAGDVVHQVGEFFDLAGDALQRSAGFVDQLDAGADLLAGGGDQGFDFLGGVGGALGERPDFGGDDREAAAGIARAGSLHAGVERQQVGLEGDFVDHADDIGDFFG